MNASDYPRSERPVLTFEQQLEVEDRAKGRYDALYRRLWPGCVIGRPTARDLQHAGLDVVLMAPGDQVITIDEKYRPPTSKDFGDFLCEVWSVWRQPTVPSVDLDPDERSVGWTLDTRKRMDYVAYGVSASGLCWLLPADRLRSVALWHWREWHARGGWIWGRTPERAYRTANVSVRWPELLALLNLSVADCRLRW